MIEKIITRITDILQPYQKAMRLVFAMDALQSAYACFLYKMHADERYISREVYDEQYERLKFYTWRVLGY